MAGIARRDVLRSAALAAGGWISLSESIGSAQPAAPAAAPATQPVSALSIRHPFHGAVLNRRHGRQGDEGLTIRVEGDAPPGLSVRVNGTQARRDGGAFSAEITLKDRESDIVASGAGPEGEPMRALSRVVWDRKSFPRYRFSIDDNSFFLRDLVQKKYKSLWDSWYLAMLRDLNRAYGVKFTVNIYYTTGDDFNLTQLGDQYKGQWRDCSGWLKLAFHAHADKPDRPYQDAEPDKLIVDLDRVTEQILRFAGTDSYAPPTVIHWGMTRPTALKRLCQRGVRALSGYFCKRLGKDCPTNYDVNYRFNDTISAYMACHDAWKDFDSGITFSRVDIVCNGTPPDKVVPTLAPQLADPNTAEIIDLFTHEQYFWPFYRNYLPDHRARVENAIRWATENNFKPVFLHEGFLGAEV